METTNKATGVTKAANAQWLDVLRFEDDQDFRDARRGLLAPLPDDGVIKNDHGRVVWDMAKFGFADEATAPDTVNPSLWRQLQLLRIGGLFEVVPGVYQVRSADLANMDIIEGRTGVIVVDPLMCTETARVALELYYAHRPRRPVVGVILTHSHIDHFGGIAGVIDVTATGQDRVPIIAPVGFSQAAMAENILAGVAMTRRAAYMYGNLLPAGPSGTVSPGLGLATPTGQITFADPTDEITEPVQNVEIDGVHFRFMLAPETEAPAEMLFHLPELRALCSAEDATHTMHNLYTLRGARTRDARVWSHYLNQAIELFGNDSDVVFGQHHWPTWGNDRVIGFLEDQRDAYKYIHDQTLRLANHGLTMTEIAEELRLPDELATRWCNRDYYGTLNHNVKAVYNLYLGWFDGNPAHLHPHTPTEAARRYVEMMGGSDEVVTKAREYFEKGDYRWVVEVVNHVVFTEPDHTDARILQAAALEQLGYQAESGVWRNFYLSGARELRGETPAGTLPHGRSPEMVQALPLEALFEFLAISLNGPQAAGHRITLNFSFPDTKRDLALRLERGVLHTFADRHLDEADASITIPERVLRRLATTPESFNDALQSDIHVDGDVTTLLTLLGLFDRFEDLFAIVEP